MIEIDGSQRSGSGTIVRYAVSLAALLGQPVRLFNARAKRKKPGLRPQHLTSVLACAEMCRANTRGLNVGSHEFTFVPRGPIHGGDFVWDIGTAGSATMLALSILPVACFADGPVTAHITGGVLQDFAPSPYYMQRILFPLLQRMGLIAELRVVRLGYVPKGGGIIELKVRRPVRGPLHPISLMEQGLMSELSGIAVSSHLEERQVSDRMARVCEELLIKRGLSARIERVYDRGAAHAGAALAVWAESSTGCFFGADRAGAFRRSSEAIGSFVANNLLEDLATGATVDRHAADQLVLFAGLSDGMSRYMVPHRTEHLDSNLWLVRQFGAEADVKDKQVSVKGVGLWMSQGRRPFRQ